jgi:NAD(P)-dependent dehydrogenase (short-subunit alcohol dehydrogenase family)
MAQVWLVTGSSRGLGRAIVEAGLAAGNRVLATASGSLLRVLEWKSKQHR